MKRLVSLCIFISLVLCISSKAQEFRFDYTATTTNGGGGNLLPVLAIPGAAVSFFSCTSALSSSCTVPLTTFTSVNGSSSCPSNAQIVLQDTNTCVSVADSQGNFGVWVAASSTFGYAYVITVFGVPYGPYQFTIGGSGGSGLGTVISVGLTPPTTLFTTAGTNPITTSGTFALTLTNAAQNSVWAGPPSGGAGVPSYQTAPTFSGANLTSIPACSACVLKSSGVTSGTASVWTNYGGNNFLDKSNFTFQIDANTDSVYTTDGRPVLIPPCVYMGGYTLPCNGGTVLQMTSSCATCGSQVLVRDLYAETTWAAGLSGFVAANDVAYEHSIFVGVNASTLPAGSGYLEPDSAYILTEFGNLNLHISGKLVDFRAIDGTSTLAALTIGASNTVLLPTLGASTSGLLKSASTTGLVSNATGLDVTTTLKCSDTSGSGTAQNCTTSPTFVPAVNSCVIYSTTTPNSGAGLTLNVNSLGAKSVAKWLGSTTLTAGDVAANSPQNICYNGTVWSLSTIGNAPSGSGNVTASGTLIGNSIVLGGNTTAVKVLPGFFTDGAGTLTLGNVGVTAGGLQIVNNTSGGITIITPPTGALGSSLATLPINTGTIAETNLAQSWGALQTFGTNFSVGGVTATGATGTGNVMFSISPVFSGTPDASGATQFKLPIAAGFASAANGEQGYDTTGLNWHIWGNGVDNINAIVPTSVTITNNDCAQWSNSAGIITLKDTTCGGTVLWNSIGNPTGNQGISMGNNTTTWTFGTATGSTTPMVTFTDSASNTGTGPVLKVATAASSAGFPAQFFQRGTALLTVGATGGGTGSGFAGSLWVNATSNVQGAGLYIGAAGLYAIGGSTLTNSQVGNTQVLTLQNGTTPANGTSVSEAFQAINSAFSFKSVGIITGTLVTDTSTSEVGSLAFSVINAGSQVNLLTLASARKGTFTCISGSTVTVPNTNAITASDIVITTNTPAGTQTSPPNKNGGTSGTNFTVLCASLDTSVYNYFVLN